MNINIVLAGLSLSSLFFVIFLGIAKPKVNSGVIAIALSFLIGILFADMSEKNISALFPGNLFIMLTGVTMFFAISEANGLIDQIAFRCVRIIRGRVSLMQIMFFCLPFYCLL